MSKRIGIIGAGTAGLHLGLALRQHHVDVTLFTDRAPEDYRKSRLLNTVAHHAVTLKREQALGIRHWDGQGYGGHHYFVGIKPRPLRFYGDLHAPSRAVDYRIYHPRLMEDFADRGGKLETRSIRKNQVDGIARDFDLIVVCTGKSPFGQMFERHERHSPHDRPLRALCVGIFKGIAQRENPAVTMYFSPGAGEMIEIPTLTFGGLQTALVIENQMGGELEVLAKTKYEDDPKGFRRLLLDKLRKHYPDCADRIDAAEFDLANGPLDLLQGGVTPTVRRSHAKLSGGKIAIALGDVQATVDPLMGQGGNMASHAAWILAEEIVQQDVFDDRFIERVDQRRKDRVLAASRWSNYILQSFKTMPPEFQRFLSAVSQHRSMADEFTDNFNFPERQWDRFASPERIEHWCSEYEGGAASASAPSANVQASAA